MSSSIETLRRRPQALSTETPPQNLRCSFARFLDNLDEEASILINETLATDITTVKFYLELKAAGITQDKGTIGRHRSGICLCFAGQEN